MTQKTLSPMFKYQFQNLTDVLDFLVADMTEEEWLTRLADEANRIGFIAWHVPNIQDFTINTLIRGVPEVRARPEWRDCPDLDTKTPPFGMAQAEADATAENSRPAAVINYAEAVRTEILAWLETVGEAELTAVPDIPGQLARSAVYKHASFSDELNPAIGKPVWALLLAACFGHLRSHLGEIEAVKRQLRQNNGQ